MKKGSIMVLGILLFSVSCHQRPGGKEEGKLSVEDMRYDLSVLWSAIREVHPGYGLYSPVDSMAQKYAATRSVLSEPLYESEFISRVTPFLCMLGCGHTQLRHSAAYRPPAGIPSAHLPFEVIVLHDRAWVTTRKTTKLATGDEIVRVNNEPVASIIRHGFELYCGDGHVQSFKELFLSEYDGFEDACGQYYHMKAPYHISLITRDGLHKDVVLDSSDAKPVAEVPVSDKYALWTKAAQGDDLALYFAKMDRTALFEVKGLAYADTNTYASYFHQIAEKKSENLILDLRHNGGGDLRIAMKLLSYLTDAPFGIVKDICARMPDPSLNSSISYFDPERTESFKGSCIPGRQEGKWWHMEIRPDFCHPYGPNATARAGRFKGNLFVLVDGATFSSAALFTTALRAQRRKLVFIGRETAGTEEGCNGFAMQQLTLPRTRVVVDFPWLRVVSMAASPAGGRGLMPDYPVEYTAQDVVSGNDPDLAKALQLIGAKDIAKSRD